ncbi:hypothetical protein D3C72_1231520 [compost metagenome]
MHVQELQDLAFGDHRGGFGQDAHDAHRVGLDHHLERTGIQVIAHQHAGGVAEYGVGGFAATAQVGLVHHVIVQQRRGVDEFHHGGQQLVMGAFVAQGASHHQHHGRAHALAARANDVVANRADQDDVRIQPIADDCIDSLHIVSNGGNKRGEIQDVSDKCEASRVTALTAGPASGGGGFDHGLYGECGGIPDAAAASGKARSRAPRPGRVRLPDQRP